MRNAWKLSVVAVMLLAGAFAVVGPASAGQTKAAVCHVDGQNLFSVVEVADPAVQAHVDHGDALPGGDVPGMPGYVFDQSCTPEIAAAILAVAYTNRDVLAGYDPALDVLIAKLVDTHPGGAVSVGDTIITNQYPEDLAGTSFGSFQTTTHVVTSVQSSSGGQIDVTAATGTFSLAIGASTQGQRELYEEDSNAGTKISITKIEDFFGKCLSDDSLEVGTSSPSAPLSNVVKTAPCSDNDPIDVDILIP